MQVCMTELDGESSGDARYFVSEAFSPLRKGLGIDGLLLSQVKRVWAVYRLLAIF